MNKEKKYNEKIQKCELISAKTVWKINKHDCKW